MRQTNLSPTRTNRRGRFLIALASLGASAHHHPWLKDALQPYSRCVAFSLLKVATNVPRPACSMARRESATRSRWRTERGRLATAATAPHGLHPLSRLWPSNSLPARRAHSNAPAAPADCQCLLSRAHVSREDSAASPPQQRLPRVAAASNAAASRRIQPPPPAAASTAATALSAAQAPPRPRVSPPRVPPPSASPWPLPPPGGRARSSI